MNQHIETLIDAYLDGELSEKQVRNVETHIKDCPECLVQLEQRRSLSSMLNSVPGYSSKKSGEQFVSEVNLLLPRQQKQTKGYAHKSHLDFNTACFTGRLCICAGNHFDFGRR